MGKKGGRRGIAGKKNRLYFNRHFLCVHYRIAGNFRGVKYSLFSWAS